MHLNKLFNGKFLLQNLKKSKMILAMFFVLVPIFTSLIIISAGKETFDFISLAGFNIFGMYFIPMIFSVCLFHYVFKKNSTDFMGSMPISRRAVFVTNTIGGIILIFLLQLLTFLLTLLVGSLTEGTIFTEMAWDILVYQTIAYLFVFVVSNLAMAVSGNMMTQIAVTMLVVFLIPFSSWFIQMASDDMAGDMDYTLMNHDIPIAEVTKIKGYTAPFYLVNGKYQFDQASIVRMLLLSCLYFGLGWYAFEKRKMEIAGESFENKYVHLAVKGLTLVPFVAILKAVAEEDSLAISSIIVAIIMVYYFIFDLMTSKRVKLAENLLGVIVSIAVIYGTFSVGIAVNESFEKTLDIKNIHHIEVNGDNTFYTQINDQNAIKNIVAQLASARNNYQYYYQERYLVEIEFVTHGGTHYNWSSWVDMKTIASLFDQTYPNNFLKEKTVITNNDLNLTAKETQAILKIVNETLQEMSFKKVMEWKTQNTDYPRLRLVQYKHHQSIQTEFPVIASKEVQKIVMTAANRYAVDYLASGGRYYSEYFIDSFHQYDEETGNMVYFALSRPEANERVKEFILQNQENVPEEMQYSVRVSSYAFVFYTDKMDDLLAMIRQIVAENQEEYEAWKQDFADEVDFEKGVIPQKVLPQAIVEEEIVETASGEREGLQ